MYPEMNYEWFWKGHVFESRHYIARRAFPYPAYGGVFIVGRVEEGESPRYLEETAQLVKGLDADELEEAVEEINKELWKLGIRELILVHPETRSTALLKPVYVGQADNFAEELTTEHPKYSDFQLVLSNRILICDLPARKRKKMVEELVHMLETPANDDF